MSSFTAALTALLLLSYASVRSIVMQVEMASPVAAAPLNGGEADPAVGPGPDVMTMDMGAMSMAHAKPTRAYPSSEHRSSRPAACPFCSAAAHLPILTGDVLIRVSQRVAFTAYRAIAVRGPRGPPVAQPRARGPPTDPLTL